jgi:hypothetical protein
MASKAYRDNYALIDFSKEITAPPKVRPYGPRSSLTCPYVISDVMDPVQAQTDGSWHTSKSSIRANYRIHGVTEVGNDPARFAKPKKREPDRKAIRESLMKAKARLNA